MSIVPLESRVAVLVDCDNVPPEIVDHALLMVAQFGRVVLRRGYGNHQTLARRWQEVLVRQAFTPCLQYQYAAGKNTSDIALALDALEAMFDQRADTFCLVTSDSDFAHLCRKLRERGATVCIVGEPKTPDALRNACDQFFEWVPSEPVQAQEETAAPAAVEKPQALSEPVRQSGTRQAPAQAAPSLSYRSGRAIGGWDRRWEGRSGRLGPIPQTHEPIVYPKPLRALGASQHDPNLRHVEHRAGDDGTLVGTPCQQARKRGRNRGDLISSPARIWPAT